MPFLDCLSSFEGTSYKKFYDNPPDILFLVFTSADMIFRKFLELDSTLSEKRVPFFVFNRFT